MPNGATQGWGGAQLGCRRTGAQWSNESDRLQIEDRELELMLEYLIAIETSSGEGERLSRFFKGPFCQ